MSDDRKSLLEEVYKALVDLDWIDVAFIAAYGIWFTYDWGLPLFLTPVVGYAIIVAARFISIAIFRPARALYRWRWK